MTNIERALGRLPAKYAKKYRRPAPFLTPGCPRDMLSRSLDNAGAQNGLLWTTNLSIEHHRPSIPKAVRGRASASRSVVIDGSPSIRLDVSARRMNAGMQPYLAAPAT